MAGSPATYNTDSQLWRATKDLTDVLAQRARSRQPHARVILTQYASDAGTVNPATQPHFGNTSTTAQPQGVPPANNSYSSSANGSNSPPNGSYTSAPSTQPVPVQPAPAYGDPMWPRQAGARPADSPEGPYAPGPIFSENSPFIGGPPDATEPLRTLDFEVSANEAMTGRMMFGVGINSDAGLVGQIMLDEQNFDWTRFPRSWEEIRNATAFRGAGQRLRLEAVPGTQVQRYMINFQNPYLMGTQISLGLSGYFYNRQYTRMASSSGSAAGSRSATSSPRTFRAASPIAGRR